MVFEKDEAGVGRVATGRKLEEFGQFAGGAIDFDDGGARAFIVEADAGDETAVVEADDLRAADFGGGVFPLPICVGRPGDAEEAVAGLAIAAEEAEESAVGFEDEAGFVWVLFGKKIFDDGFEFFAVGGLVKANEFLAGGVVADSVGGVVVPGEAPEPDIFVGDVDGGGP